MSYGFGGSTASKKWITVNGGALVVKAQENEEGATSRTYKVKDTGEEKTVWEFRYPSFTGDIEGAYFDSTQYGDFFCVDLSVPDGETYQLRINVDSRLFEQFAKRIPNIDKDLPLTIGAFTDDKKRNAIYMNQGKSKVLYAYTRDNMNGMPAAEGKEVRGKTVWDYTDQNNFLYELAKNWFPSKDASDIEDSFQDQEGPEDPF